MIDCFQLQRTPRANYGLSASVTAKSTITPYVSVVSGYPKRRVKAERVSGKAQVERTDALAGLGRFARFSVTASGTVSDAKSSMLTPVKHCSSSA